MTTAVMPPIRFHSAGVSAALIVAMRPGPDDSVPDDMAPQ